MKLAAFLLLVIVGCHYSADYLATAYEHPETAARAIYYILRGIEGSTLFAVIAVLARSVFVVLVCALGVFEESQTAVCRLAAPIDTTQSAVEVFSGLCGSRMYVLGLLAIGLVALAIDYELGRRRGKR